MQGESRNQEDDQHYRAERSLVSRSDSEAAHDHQKSCAEAEELGPLGDENARGIHRIGPTADIAKTAYQETPTQNGPE